VNATGELSPSSSWVYRRPVMRMTRWLPLVGETKLAQCRRKP